MVERGNSIVAGELEHMSRVLDDIDVDVAAFEWIHASTSIDRVLVLIYLNDVVKLIWTILISAKVIEVKPICLATLACDNAPAVSKLFSKCYSE